MPDAQHPSVELSVPERLHLAPPRFYLLSRVFQMRELVILGVLVLEIVLFGLKNPRFVTAENLFAAARYVSIVGIAAIGASLVIISGGIDLSSGAVYGLCGVFAAWLMTDPSHPVPAPVAVLLAISLGLGFGFLNGAAVAFLRIPPFIVTLGSLSIAAGLAFRITDGEHLPTSQRPFTEATRLWLERIDTHFLASAGFAGVNLGFVAMMVIAFAVAFFLNGTPLGRHIHALGGNEEAARHAGIRVIRVKVIVYTLASGLAALSGIFYLARYKGINSGVGPGRELDIIAAAVVGGVSLSGGRGSPIGAIVGALIIQILRNGLVFNDAKQADAQIAIGAFIVLAVFLDRAAPVLWHRVRRRVSR
jgi:ribose transport system permease protein